MHKTKRPLSFLLAVVMIISMFAAVPFTASAAELPDVIKDCTYHYRDFYYANVPIIDLDQDETFSTLPDGDILVVSDGVSDGFGIIRVVDAKGYAYKFYDNTGAELPASMTSNETLSGSELGLSADVILYHKAFSITFTQAALDSEVLYIVATAPATDPDVENVIDLINAIGTVEYTDACKAKIDAARAEYDDLTADQQALVTNTDTLTAAETAYANLKAAADAAADPVSYLVWDDAARKLVEMTGDNACKTYTEVTADTATFEDGMWYVVNGEILNGNRITVTGTAHLILTDGSKLTTNNGINVANGSTLNIYGQGAGTGTVTANGGSNKGAGIGGKQNESGGTVNIYGGTVTATGSGGGAGIGGGWASVGTGGTGGTITIYGGTVTANGSGMGGAGIGGGTSQSAGIVTIYGGTVTANGNYTSPGIGPGKIGSGGTLTVCGGSVTAVGTTKANAINCTVMNTIPGTGWENVNGTGDGTPIEINTEGQELTDFKKVQFLGVASIPNDQQAADAVIAKISAIGTVEYTADSKAKIDAAREAYDDLTDAQKELVTNSATLTAAETEYAALEAAATAAAALVTAKTNAKAELDSYKNADDYRDAQKTELANAIAAGKDAIDAAADTAAVATALANAKTAIDAIKTDAQLTAEEEAAAAAELATAKTNAKAELDSYKNADDYREAEQADLADAITAGKAAIDNAADTAAVAEALANAKTAIDAIKTDAELTAEEAANTVRIGSVDDWNSFAESVKNGNTYSGKTVLLTADVGPVTTMVEGTFSGTFDGDGYTLTVDISGGTVATFQNAANAVFQNFTLAGSVTGSGIHTGALVKSITGGTCSFKNVIVSANVNGAKGYVGGFVAHAGNGFTVSFKNCLYSGSINHTGTQGNFIGAFIGWSQNCTATIENCAFTGSYSNTKSFNNIGFSYNAPRSVTVSDFYSNASEVFVANVNRGTRLYTPGSYTSVEGLVINGDEWTFFTQYSDALSAAQSGGTLLMLDKAVTDAEALINAIGEVAYDDACKAKIDEARAAYDALTAEQQALVTNIGTLTDAETEYAALEAAAALAQAKTDAKDALETYKDLGDYREAQQNAVILEVTLGKSAIDAATTIADVNTALANAKTAIDAIKTDAELTAEEAAAALAQAKADAKAELANYKDPADYRPAQQTELTNAIAEGNEAIDAAADTDAVATALANAKAAIDAIKTDAQLTAEEELADAKRTAKSALLSYKDMHDYRAEQKAELSNAIDDGIAAINAATNTDEVAAALEAAKAVMDAIKTDAQLTAEEAAAEAKDWMSVRIDDRIYIKYTLHNRENLESVTVEYLDQDGVETVRTKVYTADQLTFDANDMFEILAVIAPAQIGDMVKVTILANGQSTEYEYSVAKYCEYLIANYNGENAEAVRELAKATLEYGRAANDYFSGTGFYHQSTITSPYSAEYKEEALHTAKNLTNKLSVTSNLRTKLASAAFMALTQPEFRFYMKDLTEAEAAELNDAITTNVDGVTAKFYKNGDAILLEVKGIEAKDMEKVITITVGDLGTITFSGYDFARMMAKSDDQSIAALGAALYLYGDAAKTCFA